MASYELKFFKGQKLIEIVSDDWSLLKVVAENIQKDGIDFDLRCPYCGGDCDNTDYQAAGPEFWDENTCDDCRTGVTYITPKRYEEYHNVPDSDARFEIDLTTTEQDAEDMGIDTDPAASGRVEGG